MGDRQAYAGCVAQWPTEESRVVSTLVDLPPLEFDENALPRTPLVRFQVEPSLDTDKKLDIEPFDSPSKKTSATR